MIVKIIDIHDNQINIGGVESIRQNTDDMFVMKPFYGTLAIHINGVEIMRSERPIIDNRMIKSLEVVI